MDVSEINEIKPFRVHAGCVEIEYMDHKGEFWDEVSHKKLDGEGVRNARLDEIKQITALLDHSWCPLTDTIPPPILFMPFLMLLFSSISARSQRKYPPDKLWISHAWNPFLLQPP